MIYHIHLCGFMLQQICDKEHLKSKWNIFFPPQGGHDGWLLKEIEHLWNWEDAPQLKKNNETTSCNLSKHLMWSNNVWHFQPAVCSEKNWLNALKMIRFFFRAHNNVGKMQVEKYNVFFVPKYSFQKWICKVWTKVCILIISFSTLIVYNTDKLLRVYNSPAAFVGRNKKKKRKKMI